MLLKMQIGTEGFFSHPGIASLQIHVPVFSLCLLDDELQSNQVTHTPKSYI